MWRRQWPDLVQCRDVGVTVEHWAEPRNRAGQQCDNPGAVTAYRAVAMGDDVDRDSSLAPGEAEPAVGAAHTNEVAEPERL